MALTLTAVEPTAPGFLTVHPGDVPTPVASNLNFPAGRTVANLVVVRLPPSGVIDVFHFGGRTDVIVDVVGYYDQVRSDDHGRFAPVVPVRVLDSRTSGGVTSTGGKMTPSPPGGMTYGISPSGAATAYVLNVTVTEPEDAGFATLFPGRGRPLTSNVNFSTGQTVANAAMVAGPGVTIYPSVVTHMVIDLFGAFT